MSERIGIIDIRNIIKAVHETYKIDFSDYALTSFKYRLEKIIQQNNLAHADDLILAIKQNKDFFQSFLFELSVEETEMFRDPGLWRELRDTVLPKINTTEQYRIWIPEISSGDEIYSLAITLHELKLIDHVHIIASSISKKNIDFVKKGVYDNKKMETNNANYKRAKGSEQLTDYYEVRINKAHMNTKLIDKVEFLHMNYFADAPPKKINLILYRNKLIYFNLPLQSKSLDLTHEALCLGGLLVIGIKESMESYNNDRKFLLVNESENIYKKISVA